MSKLAEALSTIQHEINVRDAQVAASFNLADKSVRVLYELRLHIETEQKRKKPSDQILAEVLAKLVPLTPDGPTK
jgi:hypothetical protein